MGVAASVLLHLVLWPVGNGVVGMAGGRPLPDTDEVMEVSLVPDARSEETSDDERAIPEVVDLDEVTDQRRPKDAKRKSEFDSTTAKETRRSSTTPSSVPKGRPRAADFEPNGGGEKSSGGKALPLGGREAVGEALKRPGVNESGKPSPGYVGEGTKPSLSPRAAKGLPDSVRKRWSPPGSRQDLDEIDPGESTVLNTQRWKYASFFNRLKNDIDQYWDPVARLRARDPDGRINGTKTRRTKLMIILNGDGSLHKVKLLGSSNVDYLDDEAIRAVRSAAPFPNPPKGMLDPEDGKLYVPFGFIVEMGKKGRIQRYRR